MLKYLIKTNKTNATPVEVNNDDISETGRNTERDRTQKRKAEVKRRYENRKRCRKFCTSWKKAFTWIKLTDDRSKMFCDVCLLYPNLRDKDSKFVKDGCSNFHIKSLRTHDKSEAHQKCISHDKAKKSTPGSTPAEKIIQKMNEIEFQKMQILFRIAHSLAKNGRPFEDFKMGTGSSRSSSQYIIGGNVQE